jgi:DNA-binding GntR family transcriptional regulator
VTEVAKRESSTDVAAAWLRNAILTGTFQPGEQLVERRITAEVHLSNIAIREAFTALAEEGMVVRLPGRGSFVTPISIDSVNDLATVRITIEQLVVRLARPRWNSDLHDAAKRVIDEMGEAAAAADVLALLRLDQQFHELFWRASGSALLQQITQQLSGKIALFIREGLAGMEQAELLNLVPLHQRWLEDFESGDAETQMATVEHHVAHSAEHMILMLQANLLRARRLEQFYRVQP